MALARDIDAIIRTHNRVSEINTVLQEAGKPQLQAVLLLVVVLHLLLIICPLGILKYRLADGCDLQIGSLCESGERTFAVFLNDIIVAGVAGICAVQLIEGLNDPKFTCGEYADALVLAVFVRMAGSIAVDHGHLIHINLVTGHRHFDYIGGLVLCILQLLGSPYAAVTAGIRSAADVIRGMGDECAMGIVKNASVTVGGSESLHHVAVNAVKEGHIATACHINDLSPRITGVIRIVDRVCAPQPQLKGNGFTVRQLHALKALVGFVIIKLQADRKSHHSAGDTGAADSIVRGFLGAGGIAGIEIEIVLIIISAADFDVESCSGADGHDIRCYGFLLIFGVSYYGGSDLGLNFGTVCHTLDLNAQVLIKIARDYDFPVVFQILVAYQRLRIAVVRELVGIGAGRFHPAHGSRVKLRLRLRQRQREFYPDICLGVRRACFYRYVETIGQRVKAAHNFVVRAAVIAGSIVLIKRCGAVGNVSDRDAFHRCRIL